MTIRFSIKYHTEYGKNIQIKIERTFKHEKTEVDFIQLEHAGDDLWTGEMNTSEYTGLQSISYWYEINSNGATVQSLQKKFDLAIKEFKAKVVSIFDEWVPAGAYEEIFRTRPFNKIVPSNSSKKNYGKKISHVIRLDANLMHAHLTPCLLGSGKELKDWDEKQPVLFEKKDALWVCKLELDKEKFSLSYKIGLFDEDKNAVVSYESGADRILQTTGKKDETHLINITLDLSAYAWRGAGLNVQLSALKTERSWGVGDFTDLFLLTDWAKATGLKMLQLLPVNDTTATHTSRDSYPYSAISAFALHPSFLNVQKLATAFSLNFDREMLDEVKQLNAASVLDYERVNTIKQAAIKQLFEKDKIFFKDDLDWFEFFDIHRHWLQPYAAFCYLRDKNGSADFSTWAEHSNYDESDIQELVGADKPHYDQVAIHYFTQYHLHLQLQEATEYAHSKGLVLKADLPIGVGRFSVDTWKAPSLFHMDQQAGAPPDAFAVKGQNWNFPTYNWDKMSEDNYAWWRQRMEQLSNYFDAVRIDHVLGFFRIWSIPLSAVQGILGRFVPALPLSAADISNAGIQLNEDRLCKPYITDEILYSLFGDKAEWVKSIFLKDNQFRPEYRTQQKVQDYFDAHIDEEVWLKNNIFDLQSDLILLQTAQPHFYQLRINVHATRSYKALGGNERYAIDQLYNNFFFNRQDDLWQAEGVKKLEALSMAANNMMLCGEDLGMVPDFVPRVLHEQHILALQVERMPKKSDENFSHPQYAPYDSVVTPSTHDMSTIREWWQEDQKTTQKFYNEALGQSGAAPYFAEDWICKQIIAQHLYSPAMWCVFLLQDILSTSSVLRKDDPKSERINIPADPHHVWNYRMHLTIEELLEQSEFNADIQRLVKESGR